MAIFNVQVTLNVWDQGVNPVANQDIVYGTHRAFVIQAHRFNTQLLTGMLSIVKFNQILCQIFESLIHWIYQLNINNAEVHLIFIVMTISVSITLVVVNEKELLSIDICFASHKIELLFTRLFHFAALRFPVQLIKRLLSGLVQGLLVCHVALKN